MHFFSYTLRWRISKTKFFVLLKYITVKIGAFYQGVNKCRGTRLPAQDLVKIQNFHINDIKEPEPLSDTEGLTLREKKD